MQIVVVSTKTYLQFPLLLLGRLYEIDYFGIFNFPGNYMTVVSPMCFEKGMSDILKIKS